MHVNHEFQLDFLNMLAKKYPDMVPAEMLEHFVFRWCEEQSISPAVIGFSFGEHSLFFGANMTYLKEHGLIEFDLPPLSEIDAQGTKQFFPRPWELDSRITAKGIDFLTDDGGLSAILNTVTVKFDADNIREMLAQGLMTANLPEEKKGLIKKAIDGASSTALQTVTSKLIEMGMSDPGAAVKAIASVFGISI